MTEPKRGRVQLSPAVCAAHWDGMERLFSAVFLLSGFLAQSGGTENLVNCIVGKACMLPCRFSAAGSEVIHWYRGDTVIHSFYYGQDQLAKQNLDFHNRTSLFENQIASGNASLLLRGVKIQDGGRYRCYSSTLQGSLELFVHLKVSAPIQSVDMEATREKVRCLSRNIYPAPNVSWSTSPSELSDVLQASTNCTKQADGLFSVEGEIRILGTRSDLTYICSITSADKTQTWRISLKSQDMTGTVGQALTIPCLAQRELTDFTLVWSFMRQEQFSNILTFNSRTGERTTNWSHQAKLDETQAQSGNGSLQLQNLNSQENAGTYNCTFSGFQSTHTVLTHINITGAATDGSFSNVKIIVGVISVVLILFLLGVGGYCIYVKKKGCSKKNNQQSPQNKEMEPMNHNQN
nr:HERV-H LTR-associating protein 2 isoform X2 [Scleropages formosus]